MLAEQKVIDTSSSSAAAKANITLQWDTYSGGVTETQQIFNFAISFLPVIDQSGTMGTTGTLAQGTLSESSLITCLSFND